MRPETISLGVWGRFAQLAAVVEKDPLLVDSTAVPAFFSRGASGTQTGSVEPGLCGLPSSKHVLHSEASRASMNSFASNRNH